MFILELAHARRHGSDTAGRTLETLIDERVQRLDASAREAIVYAAVYGREFRPELLGAALGIPEPKMVERIEQLERRGLLRPTCRTISIFPTISCDRRHIAGSRNRVGE